MEPLHHDKLMVNLKQAPRVLFFLRVSTESQDYFRQELELANYCKEKGWRHTGTIGAKISGMKKKDERPEVNELFEIIDKGSIDKLLVTEISRLGRRARDIRYIIDKCHDKGVSVVFKNIGGMESLDDNGNETVVSNIIIAIHSELAGSERKEMVARIKSGLAAAKAKGKCIGRIAGSIESNDVFIKKYAGAVKDLKNGLSVRKTCAIHCISENTVLKLRKAINQ